MKITYGDYQFEIIDDAGYTSGSTDNLNSYQHEYLGNAGYQPSAQHGIRIFNELDEIASAIIVEYGGATVIHDHSFILTDNLLLICCCNRIYALQLPLLTKAWDTEADIATCFGIHKFKDAFIVHGECSVSRIDEKGEILWNFSGGDIFAHPNKNSFELRDDRIILTDWEDNIYQIDENGNLLA